MARRSWESTTCHCVAGMSLTMFVLIANSGPFFAPAHLTRLHTLLTCTPCTPLSGLVICFFFFSWRKLASSRGWMLAIMALRLWKSLLPELALQSPNTRCAQGKSLVVFGCPLCSHALTPAHSTCSFLLHAQTLLPVTKLMSPSDSRDWLNIQAVFMFGALFLFLLHCLCCCKL